ncbi:glycoside hydrolase family 2 TIM barrel-domain containing protein [Labilibaculum antarcticum]|uniref:Beta-galactosidase n=1 Tax=Labilibaculum antarcticum TaxID=1717717 RepID=A0A1Y1CGD2_9BACT|nr:glycoside hydrolase family 2 TIM barrel-domain containing protein [Labilibaculum antarcticum]BAX79082.1 beta-galactosidase [Labilibaculum antarcticum]
MKKLLFLIFFAISMNLLAHERINFNSDWKFKLNDQLGAEAVSYEDDSWRILDLPHDWSIEGEYNENNPMGGQCGYLPSGIGWYRKTIAVPANWKGKQVEVAFDGVFMNSEVWANGRKLGVRPYGWISFAYDISKETLSSDSITFAVRVDNDKQPSARWYTGSGIYANTWIDVKEQVHVANSGIFIRTKGSTVEIDTEIANQLSKLTKASFTTSIKDPGGKIVAAAQNKLKIEAGKSEKITQSIKLETPQLWSIENPNLYTAVTEVKVGKKVMDVVETHFGVRDIEWKAETGMWINGKNVKLQGVCNHQDAGALGAAVPDKILRFRIQQLKDMGCNAIRTAHNPQTPQFYDMCDEMGMLVMDEIFDGWMKKAANDYGAHSFDEWWNRDLTDWIKRDRNHPSVVIYSVGNETHGEIGKDIVARCHELDHTRPLTSGHSGSEYMDVFGVNGSSEKMGWFDTMEKDRVFIGTENTHTWQVRGFYRTKTWYRDGYPNKRQKSYFYPDLTEEEVFSYDWTNAAGRNNYKQIFNSSYDNGMVRLTSRQNIEQLRDIPYYAGSFRWTGYDYIGEATYVHGGWPFKSFMGGAIDMANFEKDLFYLYQSQWTSKPMVHILPHWTHPTLKEGVEIPVWVYSNCDEVELFLNGKSLGKQKPGLTWDKMQCQWMVGWTPGELKAIAYKNGKSVVEKIIRTADAPSRIALSVDGENMDDENRDIVQLRVTATDEKGAFYPYGENRTYFHVIGSGKIRALDNGSPIDVEKHFEATNRIAFFGLTRAYIESTDETGDVAVLASCILGEKKQISSNKVNIDAELISLRGELPSADIQIYYTLDGSVPSTKSNLYEKSFDVELGTSVKALVLMNGKEIQQMEERFANDEGFVWNAAVVAANPGGDQAEDASFDGANIESNGSDFKGKGYIDFGRNSGGYVEWYQENDGSPGEFTLQIRYSANDKIRPEYKALLTINGKKQEVVLPALTNYRKDWAVFELKAKLGSGANTIRITALEDDGLSIDELLVK